VLIQYDDPRFNYSSHTDIIDDKLNECMTFESFSSSMIRILQLLHEVLSTVSAV